MCNIDNIPPLELQIEIMKWLPITKLIQSRSVSKSWKSIIDSVKFISEYNTHTHHHHHHHHHYQQQQQQLLVTLYQRNTVYIVNDDDDDIFSQHKVSLSLPLSCQPSFYYRNNMIGYSHGLFAFYNYDAAAYLNSSTNKRDVAVIWNPSIRKSVDVSVPNVLQWPYETVFGFGVCNATDPIIVKINNVASIEFESTNIIPWQVEVFKLSSRAWRSLSSDDSRLPRKSLKLTKKSIVIDRFIYWIATDRLINTTILLSFDITSEVFTEISFPTTLACVFHDDLHLSKLNESLVVLKMNVEAGQQEYGIWIMDNVGVGNSFRKVYTVKAPEAASIIRVLGFRKNGQSIIEIRYDSDKQTPVSVYEPELERFVDTGIYGNGYACFAGSYVPTLLLLDY